MNDNRRFRLKILSEKLLAAVLILLCFSLARAVEADRTIAQLYHEIWQAKDGLPHQTVQAICQTRDGYIWLGTHGGLVRFDGVKFTNFNQTNTEAIRDNRITSLVEASDGALWIGTDGGGLVKFKDNNWTTFTTSEGLPHNRVRAIFESCDGSIWIGTFGGGLGQFKDNVFKVYRVEDGLADRHVLAISEDRENRLWIGTRGGLNSLENGKLTVYGERENLPRTAILKIINDNDGKLWVGGADGLSSLENGKFVRTTGNRDFPIRDVQTIYADSAGTLWLGTLNNGIARLANGKIEAFAARDGLSDDNVLAITEDGEKNLWVGTTGGLNKFSGGKFVTYTTRDGLAQNYLSTVYQTRSGSVWIGAANGKLTEFYNGKFKIYSAAEGLNADFIGAMHESADGSLWIGANNGLFRIKDGKFANYTNLLRGGSLLVSAIYSIGDDVLIATGMTVNRLRDGKLLPLEGQPENLKYVSSIYADDAGIVWLGTRIGLVKIENGKATVFSAENNLPDVVIQSIYDDKKGSFWLATRGGGLVRLRNGKFTIFTTKDGLFDNLLFQVLEDDHENLWLSSNRGIFRVAKNELNEFADGKIARVNSVSYDETDGMKSTECVGSAQPAGWKTTDGKLWFPTTKGVTVVDPNNLKENPFPPVTILENVTVDGNLLPTGENIRLSPGADKIEFQFTGLSFAVPQKIRFKYKLEGYDADWIDAGTNRSATYTNIPPGDYSFKVLAANSDGVWSATETKFDFSRAPYFYQTAPFYLSVIMLFLFSAWLLHRLRVERMKKEFSAVLSERARIAREIHDTLAQGFAGISIQLEAGKEMLYEAPKFAEEHLDQANILARECLDEAREFVWDLRHASEKNGDFAARFERLARRLTHGMSLDFKVSGTPKPLSDKTELNLLRAGQEALVNVVRHAQASRVDVEILFEARNTRLRVKDNGNGFDAEGFDADNHFGLLGIRERIKEMSGRIELQSQIGRGTEIAITIPNRQT